MEHFYGLVVGILSVWRITHLLHAEGGPWDAFSRLRRLAGTSNFWSGLFGCFYCLSIWVAAPFALLLVGTAEGAWRERLLLWPALSGGAILLERLSSSSSSVGQAEPVVAAAAYYEDEGEEVKPDVRMQTNSFSDSAAGNNVPRGHSENESGWTNPRSN